MRGPSSSHCAASLRIGRMARDLMGAELTRVLVEYDPNGSLVTTHASQGSDMGLFGGFLGWQADDDRLPEFAAGVRDAGILIEIRYVSYGAQHPNTYKLTLTNPAVTRTMTAISTGGGMMQVVEIEGAPVAMDGGYHETLVFTSAEGAADLAAWIGARVAADAITIRTGREAFLQISGQAALEPRLLAELEARQDVECVRSLAPVLPVRSRRDLEVPFSTCAAMLEYAAPRQLALWELAVHYEAARGGLAPAEVIAKMTDLVRIMDGSIRRGLAGTEYADRILGCQSVTFLERMNDGGMVAGDALNRAILFTTAIMEVKSSMGVIVAAPTAGSCGALPGACLGVASAIGSDEATVVRAMLAAGMIGVFVAGHATFAAEVGGCMAECGAGSGMAAAAIVTLHGGTLEQALGAASMALQNSFGLTCDPVANRVEAPCLGRNVMAASNALACANMALADFAHLIPLDQVIDAMDQIGRGIPHELRCTGLGGLSITPASKAIEARLNGNG
ncbi:MAG: L-serine ammonia-lyase, iron-sulfur-dependent, subunit alpha [Planctomycetes bacterium]|nr:L-serine ammonia-lyase, iron-sulfur-dependent, subunit alpha [Planctomycetota bacterium]MCB9868407.1 L-serine ammonia-lyase, iron-sulfur-dependent, subunit alpha [Planctomycetota bacterium]